LLFLFSGKIVINTFFYLWSFSPSVRGQGLGLSLLTRTGPGTTAWPASGGERPRSSALSPPAVPRRPAQGLHGRAQRRCLLFRAREAAGLGAEVQGLQWGRRCAAKGWRRYCCAERREIKSSGQPMVIPRRRRKGNIGNDQTVRDLCKQVYHEEENDEGYLLMVMADAETPWFWQKSSPESSPET